MLIFLESEIAFLTYGLAVVLSLLPKKLYSNMFLTILDVMAFGAGDVVKKRYFDALLLFLVSLFGLALMHFLLFLINPYFSNAQITYITNFALLGTFLFVILHSPHSPFRVKAVETKIEIEPAKKDTKEMEIFKEKLINNSNKQLEEYKQKYGYLHSLRTDIPITLSSNNLYRNSIGETYEEEDDEDDYISSTNYVHTNSIGETYEEREQNDIDWLEEVIAEQDYYDELHREEEMNHDTDSFH